MKRTRNILLAEFLVVVALALGLAVLYECDVLCAGMLATNDALEFALATLMELVTLVSIPVALRMFKYLWLRAHLASWCADGCQCTAVLFVYVDHFRVHGHNPTAVHAVRVPVVGAMPLRSVNILR